MADYLRAMFPDAYYMSDIPESIKIPLGTYVEVIVPHRVGTMPICSNDFAGIVIADYEWHIAIMQVDKDGNALFRRCINKQELLDGSVRIKGMRFDVPRRPNRQEVRHDH